MSSFSIPISSSSILSEVQDVVKRIAVKRQLRINSFFIKIDFGNNLSCNSANAGHFLERLGISSSELSRMTFILKMVPQTLIDK